MKKLKRRKVTLILILLVLLIIIVAIVGVLKFAEGAHTANVDMDAKRGIDVSKHQGKINWDVLANEHKDVVGFVYIKATEGADYVDPQFYNNINGAREAGFPVGVYHYFRMSSSISAQMNNLKSVVKPDDVDLIPMVDVENMNDKPRAEVQDSLRKFIKEMEKYFGAKVMIYGTQRSYNTYCAPQFNSHPLMIGRYNNVGKVPEIRGKGVYTIWQYSEHGRLSGVPKDVDFDIFNPNKSITDILMPGAKVQDKKH